MLTLGGLPTAEGPLCVLVQLPSVVGGTEERSTVMNLQVFCESAPDPDRMQSRLVAAEPDPFPVVMLRHWRGLT